MILNSQHLNLEGCHSALVPENKPDQPFSTADAIKIPPFFQKSNLNCINEQSGVQQRSVTHSFFVTVTKATTRQGASDGRGQKRVTLKVILYKPFFSLASFAQQNREEQCFQH